MRQSDPDAAKAGLGHAAQMGRPPDKSRSALRVPDLEKLLQELEPQRVAHQIDKRPTGQKHVALSNDQMGPSMWQVQLVQLGRLD